jgi:hypothetical protein
MSWCRRCDLAPSLATAAWIRRVLVRAQEGQLEARWLLGQQSRVAYLQGVCQITGASAFVNRMFEACGSYQWAREFLKNSLEAEDSKVEFGIEW